MTDPTESEHVSAGELEIHDSRVLRMLEAVQDEAVSDPQEVAIDIVARILRKTDVQDILTPPRSLKAREVLDEPLVVRGVHWNESDFTEGFPVYAVVEATSVKTGEELAVTCGGRNVIAQLYAINKVDGFPVGARFVAASRPTARGYTPLWLVWEPGEFTEADETAS